jgi:predicted Zn-dependent protease
LKRIRSVVGIIVGACLAGAVFLTAPPAVAQGGLKVIRDTEIENTIRAYLAPLFSAAGLDADTMRVTIVNDPRLNAFVTGGRRIFVHTGLLMRAESPGQVIGVLAHEIGHITGGHLARLQEALENATTKSIIAMVLGGAVAIASGNPAGLGAGATAGATIAQRSMLAYNRTMEQSADQTAVNLLDETGQSAQGLYDFLHILKTQSALYTAGGNLYTSSHPLTKQRIDFVEQHLAHSKFTNVPDRPDLMAMHRRMRGKLKGFLDPPEKTLRHYRPDDPRIEARYARSIALSRTNEVEEALRIIDGLLTDAPDDPFRHELKGDILREAQRVPEAIESYETAIRMLPWAALIRIHLARLQVERNDPRQTEKALENLEQALRYERDTPIVWRIAATAYGRLGNRGMTALALAEEAFLRNKTKIARSNAERALKLLPEGSPGAFQAQDILSATEKLK